MMKYFLLSCMVASSLYSQNSDFEIYLMRFPQIELPFHFGYIDSLTKSTRKVVPLNDYDILKYIELDDSIPSYLPYRYYPFGKFSISDDKVVVIYIIKGGSGGIEMYFQLAMYNLVTKTLIDRMMLSAITGDFGGTSYSEGVIDSQFHIQQDRLRYERDRTTDERKLVSLSRNEFAITNNGFVVIEGNESLPFRPLNK